VALLGKVDSQGYFNCNDFCLAGVPFRAELPQQVNITKKQGLFDNLARRKFIAFVSGLNFGGLSEQS